MSNYAFCGIKRALFLSTTFAAALNTRSAGAEVAGIQRIFFASNQTQGNLMWFSRHHCSGQR
jgi:hypothetical protein